MSLKPEPTSPPAVYVDVAPALPIREILTYSLPLDLREAAHVGARVLVSVQKRRVTGYIVGLHQEPPPAEIVLKPIEKVLDPVPLIDPSMMRLSRWAADYYFAPLGEVLKSALPPGLAPASDFVVSLTPEGAAAIRAEDGSIGPRELALLHYLLDQGTVPLGRLKGSLRSVASAARLSRLSEKGWIEVRSRLRLPAGKARGPRPRASSALDEHRAGGAPALTSAQMDVVARVRMAMEARRFEPILLHGVTGSGKTEVYMGAAANALDRGGEALILVPEIALTPQLLGRFESRFPGEIAVLHSGLTDAERREQWLRIREGRARIAIGARSAIFAPFARLGVLVVDEEHEASYKQEEGFRYSARDLAVVRGQMLRIPVLLGSATPSIESYHNALQGRYGLAELKERIVAGGMPPVEIVDMRDPVEHAAGGRFFSRALVAALGTCLSQGGQTLLFLNRRGHSTSVLCSDCGSIVRCPQCSVSLTYHRAQKQLLCHYCDHAETAPERCPNCQGATLKMFGAGTERIAEEVARFFPDARVERMDRDTTRARGGHAAILKRLASGEIQVLVGTQMIAKGHDFPGVLLVGVVSLDTSLSLPDFRATERAFQILVQVAGRAGRAERPGRVIVQGYNPDHYCLRFAKEHDYRAFFDREIGLRQETAYPPFVRLAAIHFDGKEPTAVREVAHELAASLRGTKLASRIAVLGPAPSPLEKIRTRYRYQILLKATDPRSLHALLAECIEAKHLLPGGHRGVRIQVDVDPVQMM